MVLMAIEQHPLPQDISNYRFRLIGDMTIKQFGALGIFAVGAVIVYASPLPFFFKYPIAFALLMVGIGIAFVPIQGRPMDQWIIAFIKSIYSPTQYIWRQQPIETSPTVQKPSTLTAPVSSTPSINIQTGAPAPVNPTSPKDALFANRQTLGSTNIRPSTVTEITTQNAVPASTTIPSSPTTQATTVTKSPAPTTNLPIPFTPTTPNTLVGLTLTPDNHILDGVLVEIRAHNQTLRATKSNKLGQFMFARPLENGLYQILAEKEGAQFLTYSLELKGEIVKPLKIQAQNHV